MENTKINFEELMFDHNYWNNVDLNEVLIENGDKFENPYVIEDNEASSKNDIYDDMFDMFLEEQEMNESIIEEAMEIHSSKRYNRKYINARKHLIKDKKRVLSQVAVSKDFGQLFKDIFYEKNVVRVENETVSNIDGFKFVEFSQLDQIFFYGKPVYLDSVRIIVGSKVLNNGSLKVEKEKYKIMGDILDNEITQEIERYCQEKADHSHWLEYDPDEYDCGDYYFGDEYMDAPDHFEGMDKLFYDYEEPKIFDLIERVQDSIINYDCNFDYDYEMEMLEMLEELEKW